MTGHASQVGLRLTVEECITACKRAEEELGPCGVFCSLLGEPGVPVLGGSECLDIPSFEL